MPSDIASYCQHELVESRYPAWVELSPDGSVLGSGGFLKSFGLADLRPGSQLAESFPYLVGQLPMGGRPVVLPQLRMPTSRYADVHIIPGQDTIRVLWLDCTSDSRLKVESQQEANELRLSAEKMRSSVMPSLFACLEWLLLERTSSGSFEIVGIMPDWARPFLGTQGTVDPVEEFPFLESFMPEAEDIWKRPYAPGTLATRRSGIWIETVRSGLEVRLEAIALKTAGHHEILMVERQGAAFAEHMLMIQRGREHALEFSRLERDIEKKDVLLHCIVHDLRAPLTALLSSLWMLASGKLSPEETARTADLGLRQGRRQERLIDSILEVFSHEVNPSTEESNSICDLAAVIREEGNGFSIVAERQGIMLHLEGVENALTTRGEAARLSRVFANLIENAIRHTPTGGVVSVIAKRVDDRVTVCVENDGDAVPEDQRDQLFSRFFQGPNKSGAVGLGLFYCRITLDRYGGSIFYEARDQGGSRFRVELPMGAALR